MRNVAHGSVLVVEPTVHLLRDVATVFGKLAQGVSLYPLDFVFLTLEFVFKFLHQITLLSLPLITLIRNTLLNLTPFFSQIRENLTFLLYAAVLFGL